MKFEKSKELGFTKEDLYHIFNVMSDEEYQAYVDNYNAEAEELSNYIKHLASTFSREFYPLAPVEIKIVERLLRTRVMGHSGIYVPKFHEAIALQASTGCTTAFMSEAPLRTVMFKDFADALSPLGMIFIMFHEMQHYYRRHITRLMRRNPYTWNVATDLVINFDLLYNKLPKIAKEAGIKTRFNDRVTKFDIYDDGYEYLRDMANYIGNEFPPEHLIGTPSDMSDWFKRFRIDKSMTEEDIYEAIKMMDFGNDMNQSDNLDNDKNQSDEQNKNSQDGQSDEQNQNGEGQSQQNGGQPQDGQEQDGQQPQDSQGQSQNQNGPSQSGGNGQSQDGQQQTGQGSPTGKIAGDTASNGNLDDEQHIHTGHEMFKKIKDFCEQQNEFDKIFGKRADQMRNEMRKIAKDYGMPETKADEAAELQKNKDEINKIRHEVRQEFDNFGTEAGDLDESIRRENDIESKLQFAFMLESMARIKSNSGRYEPGQEPSVLSRMSKLPDMQKNMNIPNRLFLKKKEQTKSELNALVIIDTSGSVSMQDYQEFLAEIRNAVINYDLHLHCVPADVEAKASYRFVINKENFEEYEKNGFKFSGGGGTNMLGPLANELVYAKGVEKNGYDIAIVFSDGGFSAFSKDELMKEMRKAYNRYEKDSTVTSKEFMETKKRLKEVAGEFQNPVILMANTQEMCWGETVFKGFKQNELQEFVISKKASDVVKVKPKRNNRMGSLSNKIKAR